jgi:hypothetical protein
MVLCYQPRVKISGSSYLTDNSNCPHFENTGPPPFSEAQGGGSIHAIHERILRPPAAQSPAGEPCRRVNA